jgi:hypothetical protein
MPVFFFIAVWSIVALCLGAIFAFKPEIPTDRYIAQMERHEITNTLRKRLIPRPLALIWFRLGGIFFLVMSMVLPVLAMMGALDGGRD